jgi:glycosyltransferase involved in cell wall biosynthesis
MKLCIVSGIYPPDAGGPAVYVSRIAKALHSRGLEITLVIPEGKGDARAREAFEVKTIPWRGSAAARQLSAFRILTACAAGHDLLFINGMGIPAVLAARRLRMPAVLKVVGDFAWERARNRGWTTSTIDAFQKEKGSLKVRGLRKARNFYVRKADRVVTPSRYLADMVEKWGVPAEKIRVVYNAVEEPPDPLPERAAARESLGLKGLTVVSVGRLVNWKGMDGLIRVFPRLADDPGLVIIGDGPESARLRDQASRTASAGRIRFTGTLPRQDVLRYLKAADVLVLNSVYEGLSHLLLESMLCGTAVVATRCGGNPEVITHGVNGSLIGPNRDDELSGALGELLGDPDRREAYVRAGYKKLEDFRWPRLVEETVKVFKEAAARS